jgi:hypothetical protein
MFTTTIAALIIQGYGYGRINIDGRHGKMMSSDNGMFPFRYNYSAYNSNHSSRLKEKKHVFAKILNGNKMEKNTEKKKMSKKTEINQFILMDWFCFYYACS